MESTYDGKARIAKSTGEVVGLKYKGARASGGAEESHRAMGKKALTPEDEQRLFDTASFVQPKLDRRLVPTQPRSESVSDLIRYFAS